MVRFMLAYWAGARDKKVRGRCRILHGTALAAATQILVRPDPFLIILYSTLILFCLSLTILYLSINLLYLALICI